MQGLANSPWVPAQVQQGNDYGNSRFNHVVDAEIGSADDGSTEAFVFSREKFRVPFDPSNGLAEFRLKLLRSPGLP